MFFLLFLLQTLTYSVKLTWVDTKNPVGTTYNVWRSNGQCPLASNYALLAAGLTVKEYVDTTVARDKIYCYSILSIYNSASQNNPESTVVMPQAVIPILPPSQLNAVGK